MNQVIAVDDPDDHLHSPLIEIEDGGRLLVGIVLGLLEALIEHVVEPVLFAFLGSENILELVGCALGSSGGILDGILKGLGLTVLALGHRMEDPLGSRIDGQAGITAGAIHLEQSVGTPGHLFHPAEDETQNLVSGRQVLSDHPSHG